MNTTRFKSLILSFAVFLMLALSNLNPLIAQETLTNGTIIKMSKAGLGDSVIIKKMQSPKVVIKFNTSIDSIIYLKEHGVSNGVIASMQDVTALSANDAIVNEHSSDPIFMHPSGIYYYNQKNEKGALQKIEENVPSSVNGSRESVYFFGETTRSYCMNGESANIQVNDSLPVFYFYFDEDTLNKNKLNYDNRAHQITSPNMFTLVNLSIKNHSRCFEGGKATGTGFTHESAVGISDKNKVDFKWEKIRQGIFKLYLLKPMFKGEYAFTYAGNDRSGMLLYDWGIDLRDYRK